MVGECNLNLVGHHTSGNYVNFVYGQVLGTEIHHISVREMHVCLRENDTMQCFFLTVHKCHRTKPDKGVVNLLLLKCRGSPILYFELQQNKNMACANNHISIG